MKAENLKVIIFDLGGVILNLDINKTLIGFKKLFGDNFDILHEAHLNESFFLEYEKGHISCEAFRDYLREVAKKEASDDEIDIAWNLMLEDLPKERMKWLEDLKQNYKICILSNTNVIHLDAFHKIFAHETSYDHPDQFFDQVYYSCYMGMRKPDEEIYFRVLEDLNIQPHEALFLDDKQENILSAEQLGINVMAVERNNLKLSMLPKLIKSV